MRFTDVENAPLRLIEEQTLSEAREAAIIITALKVCHVYAASLGVAVAREEMQVKMR